MRKVTKFMLYTFVFAIALMSVSAMAVVYYWVGPDGGDFFTTSNWSPAGVPKDGDTMRIWHVTAPGPNSGGPVFDRDPSLPYTVYGVSNAQFVGSGISTGYGAFTMQRGDLGFKRNFNVGSSAKGYLNINGGTLNIGASGTGNGWPLYVGTGTGGEGYVNMTDGALKIWGQLFVANAANSKGSVVITGGSVDLNSSADIGTVGEGYFEINNATVTQVSNAWINVGKDAGSKGTIKINSGVLNTQSGIWIAQNAPAYWYMNGGLVNNSWVIFVGMYNNGYWTQTDGELNQTGASFQLGGAQSGVAGTGYLTLSGGEINITTCYMGCGWDWTGTDGGAIGKAVVDMSGGILNACTPTTDYWIQFGNKISGNTRGTCVMTQTGGMTRCGKLEFYSGLYKLQGGSCYAKFDGQYPINLRDGSSVDFAGGVMYSKYDQTDHIMQWVGDANGYYDPKAIVKSVIGNKMYTSIPGKTVLCVYGPNQAPGETGSWMKVWAGDPAVVIDGGAVYSNDNTVMLTMNGIPGDPNCTVTQMRISEDGTFDTEAWETYTTTKNYTFIDTTPGMKMVSVQFMDSNGNISPTSDSLYTSTLAYTDNIGLFDGYGVVKTIAEAKQMPADNTIVIIENVMLTANLSGGIGYIQDPNTSIGIKVDSGNLPNTLGLVTIQGEVSVYDGEKVITGAVFATGSNGLVEPVAMNVDKLGGGDWYYDSNTDAGQKGVVDGVGLNNIGTLVRVTGKFIETADDYLFTLNDGSAVVECEVPLGITLDNNWKWVTATGVCSTKSDGSGGLIPVVRIRNQGDILPVAAP